MKRQLLKRIGKIASRIFLWILGLIGVCLTLALICTELSGLNSWAEIEYRIAVAVSFVVGTAAYIFFTYLYLRVLAIVNTGDHPHRGRIL